MTPPMIPVVVHWLRSQGEPLGRTDAEFDGQHAEHMTPEEL
jgi:hypothetical protein